MEFESGRDEKWHLLHNGKDSGHEFNTAKEAIEHAEDARKGKET